MNGPPPSGRAAGRGRTVGLVTWRRGLIGAAAVLTTVAVVLAVRAVGVPDVRTTVAASGGWAPLLFVVLSGAVTITPIPRTFFTVAAGALFGSVVGVLLAAAGAVLAAVCAFWLARLVGGRFMERHAHRPGLVWIRRRLDRSGLLAVLSLRLIPLVPFSWLNYAAGMSGVKFLPYLLGTIPGILPGTATIVILGDAVTGGDPHPALLAVSVVCGAIGAAGALVAVRRPVPPLD